MRTLRVTMAMVGGAPVLVSAAIVSAAACGEIVQEPPAASHDAAAVDAKDSAFSFIDTASIDTALKLDPTGCYGSTPYTWTIEMPPPGVAATAAMLCATSTPTVESTAAARVAFANYDGLAGSAIGTIEVPTELLPLIDGLPEIKVVGNLFASEMAVENLAPMGNGFRFDAKWNPEPEHSDYSEMQIEVALTLKCADGGLKKVTSTTMIARCLGDDAGPAVLVSQGGECSACRVIAEMAPTPIVSDNRGDDLPLGRVIGLRIRELARAGKKVVLLAENDAGETSTYEWRVSGGLLEHLADDVVIWTVPETTTRPFGQVAVWNDEGAAVENFVWAVAS